MKKFWIILIVMLTAGCAGMGGSSGYSSGASGSGDSADDIYRPNMNSTPFAPFKGMDSSFQPYYGG